ncbi:hypothetical protein SeMB42_g01877 [Synchytrium endobioticum]|uniref:Uncharacterized protein n=1 Tax=Synchytrium endobioticum TaxID=286115 RepID=A0A507DK57_9FUNG|nr:hypothetical protein SeMB42_g01877 [Synchytrium endobioticum]
MCERYTLRCATLDLHPFPYGRPFGQRIVCRFTSGCLIICKLMSFASCGSTHTSEYSMHDFSSLKQPYFSETWEIVSRFRYTLPAVSTERAH